MKLAAEQTYAAFVDFAKSQGVDLDVREVRNFDRQEACRNFDDTADRENAVSISELLFSLLSGHAGFHGEDIARKTNLLRFMALLPEDLHEKYKIHFSLHPGGDKEFALCFGNRKQRQNLMNRLKDHGLDTFLDLQTIDACNDAIDVSVQAGSGWEILANVLDVLCRIRKGKLSVREKIEDHPHQSVLRNWADFLELHHEKVDVLKFLKAKTEGSDQPAEIVKAFLLKNTDAGTIIDADLVNEIHRLTQAPEVTSAKPMLQIADLVDGIAQDKLDDIGKALTTALFRRTSKLAIEFAIASNLPLIFKLEKFKEYDDYDAGSGGIDKCLKDRDMRLCRYRIADDFESGKQWTGAGPLRRFPITHSEIRKLQKVGKHNNIRRVFGDCDYLEIESVDNGQAIHSCKQNEREMP